MDVAQICLPQLIRSGPGGKNGGIAFMLLQKISGTLMQSHIIAISEVIFGSKSIRRIKEQRHYKEDQQEGCGPLPAQDAPPERGYGNDDQQRVSRQKVSRE